MTQPRDRFGRFKKKKYERPPRKGTVAVGSDADLVIVDMEHEEILRAEFP